MVFPSTDTPKQSCEKEEFSLGDAEQDEDLENLTIHELICSVKNSWVSYDRKNFLSRFNLYRQDLA